MAELQVSTTAGKKKGFYKGKKLSTRMDLTPMVDLGFLLITFFIFTSAIARPNAMKLTMPNDTKKDVEMPVSEEKTISILLGRNNKLYYYHGAFNGKVNSIDYKSLRDIIIDKKRQLLRKFGVAQLVVLIKVTEEAKFKNIVDSLDEMVINDVFVYMLLDPEKKELKALQ